MTTPGSNGPHQQPEGGAPGPGPHPGGGAPGPGPHPGGYSPQPGGGTPPPPPGGYGQGHPGGAPYPPQGGAPYQGQPGQPGGEPYQGQPGQPGGAPYPPQGGAPFPPQGTHATPQRSGPPKWLIPVIAGVVIVGAALALFAFFGSNTAEVGDCVAQTGVDEVELVDCDDDSAIGRVLGFEEDEISYEEYLADPATCDEFPEAIGAYWEGREGEDGRVVCVGTV